MVQAFLKKWWVDDKNCQMFCAYCEEYPLLTGHNSFVMGSTTFHLTNIRSHDSTKAHIQCISRYNSHNSVTDSTRTCRKPDECGNTTIDKTFTQIWLTDNNRLDNVFKIPNSVYFQEQRVISQVIWKTNVTWLKQLVLM